MRLLLLFFLLWSSYSQGHINHIYGKKQLLTSEHCSRYLKIFESKFDIPNKLLEAVAINETGRYHKNLNIHVPWPWSVNFLGKSYYFDSKYEAVFFVRQILNKGIRNVDVGCMQVNLHHHGSAFRSVNDAFDPQKNIAYAAHLIKKYYISDSDWIKAVGKYHSHTPEKSTPYANNVESIWKKRILEHKIKTVDNYLDKNKAIPKKIVIDS
jgi:soluble lytic murein transglycosylase-like protein